MIHLERLKSGLRRVREIVEVTSDENKSIVLKKLFDLDLSGSEAVLKRVGELTNRYKLEK